MINYLYGELNEHVAAVEYEGKTTPTIKVTVDNADRTIGADLLPLTPANIGIELPPADGHMYVLTCSYVCPNGCKCACTNKSCCPYHKKVPAFKWVIYEYNAHTVASDFTINDNALVVDSASTVCCGCVPECN